MRCERLDNRSNRGILLDIERKLDILIGEQEMDLYDRIIAGVAALQTGDTTALQQHVAAIDTHLSAVDASQLQLQGDDTASKGRLDAIEAGLGKIADAVGPAAASAPADGTAPAIPANGDPNTSPAAAPADGTGSADQQP